MGYGDSIVLTDSVKVKARITSLIISCRLESHWLSLRVYANNAKHQLLIEAAFNCLIVPVPFFSREGVLCRYLFIRLLKLLFLIYNNLRVYTHMCKSHDFWLKFWLKIITRFINWFEEPSTVTNLNSLL